jgi:2-isopropylmalate synthase
VARFIAELANLPVRRDQAFVGRSAFAHKGGIHVSAVMKDSSTYEHVQPEMVGNQQRVLLSDLSGRGNVAYKLKQLGLRENLTDSANREILQRIKHMEHQGYDFEASEGTFELLVREAAHPEFHPFEVVNYEVTTKLCGTASPSAARSDETVTSASVTLRVDDAVHSSTATGQGPVHALDVCLRQCLASIYPAIMDVHLTDYKVRVLGAKGGTESKVRVLVEWTDHRRNWATVGISDDVIDASWRALVDALRLELMRLLERNEPQNAPVRDFSWAV